MWMTTLKYESFDSRKPYFGDERKSSVKHRILRDTAHVELDKTGCLRRCGVEVELPRIILVAFASKSGSSQHSSHEYAMLDVAETEKKWLK